MTCTRWLSVAMIPAALGACLFGGKGKDASPKGLDPVGVYEFSSEIDGTPFTGTITITGAPGNYGGVVAPKDIGDPAPIRSVVVAGSNITIVATTPDGPATFQLLVAGNAFSGSWSVGDQAGRLTGTKLGG